MLEPILMLARLLLRLSIMSSHFLILSTGENLVILEIFLITKPDFLCLSVSPTKVTSYGIKYIDFKI